MNQNLPTSRAQESDHSHPSEAWLFAQEILGRPIPNPIAAQGHARQQRERLEWLAQISTRHEDQLRDIQRAESKARHDRELLVWLAQISDEHESKLRALLREEAEAREAHHRHEQIYETYSAAITEWNEADHPRQPKGSPEGGEWAPKGGGGGGGRVGGSTSFFDRIRQRNSQFAELTGVVTPGMIRANRLTVDLESAISLPGEVAQAAASGLVTGGKAVVNGVATAVKDTATLGLSPGQLELIGVTKEDRARGYDTAVAISTGSGQVLIAVGTSGITSALSKGGSVARAANGTLIAYDTAGNAVGVVQGVYDASQDGVTVANGAKVAAGALGLGANATALKGLKAPQPAKPPADPPPAPGPPATSLKTPSTAFRVGKHSEMPTPRPGQHSHHGVMSAWIERKYPTYDADKAPAILMPEMNHRATYPVYLAWRAQMKRALGGTFDWNRISESEARALSEKMFDAAEVPYNIRQEYWKSFEKMKDAFRETTSESFSRENFLWSEPHTY